MLTSFDNRFHITLLRRIAIKNTRRKKNSGNGTISCGINWPDVKVGRALAAAGGLRRREKGWNVDGSKAGFVRIYVCANERSLCWSVKRQREKYCLQSSWHGNVRFVSCIIFVIFFVLLLSYLSYSVGCRDLKSFVELGASYRGRFTLPPSRAGGAQRRRYIYPYIKHNKGRMSPRGPNVCTSTLSVLLTIRLAVEAAKTLTIGLFTTSTTPSLFSAGRDENFYAVALVDW